MDTCSQCQASQPEPSCVNCGHPLVKRPSRATAVIVVVAAAVAVAILVSLLGLAIHKSLTTSSSSSVNPYSLSGDYQLTLERHDQPGYMYLLNQDCTGVVVIVRVKDRPVTTSMQFAATSPGTRSAGPNSPHAVIRISGTYGPPWGCGSEATVGMGEPIAFYLARSNDTDIWEGPWVYSILAPAQAQRAGILPPMPVAPVRHHHHRSH